MASTTKSTLVGDVMPEGYFQLTPQQQYLLLAALNSNMPSQSTANANGAKPSADTIQPPKPDHPDAFGSQYEVGNGTPALDFDLFSSIGDDNFVSAINGADGWTSVLGEPVESTTQPSSVEGAETHDKRMHPDDGDDDADDNDHDDDGRNKAKRREGPAKVPKKPGRKLLTEEPTTKRKAQNRAAQRAFRERKEKHLKDLETKVKELEKASKDSDQQNSMLRAEIQRMTTELEEYKKRFVALNAATRLADRDRVLSAAGFGGPTVIGSLGDVNFEFEFPRFGSLPGPGLATTDFGKPASPISPQQQLLQQQQKSPAGLKQDVRRHSPASDRQSSLVNSSDPSSAAGNSPLPMTTPDANKIRSRGSVSSCPSLLGAAVTGSPLSSHNSNIGSSPDGTSPESSKQSPMGFTPLDSIATTGQEQSRVGGAALDFINPPLHDFDWLAKQNGGTFNPQIFGDYREPQNDGFDNNVFDDSLFDGSSLFPDLDADFTTQFFAPTVTPAAVSALAPQKTQLTKPAAKKPDLIAQIDAQKEAVEDDIVPTDHVSGENYNPTEIWHKLQTCPKVQSGEVDMDALCSELAEKATCNGHEPVVDGKVFDSIVKKYVSKK